MKNEDKDQVCILGMGYVGLTLAVVMAECGYNVTGIEINPDTCDSLQEGTAHFYEVGLNSRLARQLKLGNLCFTRDYRSDLVRRCTIFVLTVGTPLGEDGQPRMDMVQRATTQVAESMPDGSLVILRSTVKLGTSRSIVKPILDDSKKNYMLAYCPERTIEGKALEELRYLPQVVGGLASDHAWRATQLFQRVTPTTIRVSSLEAAELVKLLDNSYRDLFFSFGNEVSLLCEAAGLDGIEVITAANTGYERTNIARPGLVGGPCLEKDPHILAVSTLQYGFTPKLITTGRALNEDLPNHIIRLIDLDMQSTPIAPDAKIAVCGLAFKGRPETDDLRGTPVKYLIKSLRERHPNCRLVGQDFAVKDAGIRSLGLEPASLEDAFAGSQLVLIANNNAKYQWVDTDKLFASMAQPGLVFDIWNVLQTNHDLVQPGVRYTRLGSSTAWRSK